MLPIPEHNIPIVEINTHFDIRIFVKREDLIHPKISGNKYWKLFFNVNQYLFDKPINPLIISFGGAFSNHIAAVAAFGNIYNIPTMGIIRGEELINQWQENPTLKTAYNNGMQLRFVSRKDYQDKSILIKTLSQEFPHALIVPEGGSNETAIQGIQYMLGEATQDFDYLCSAVGTGGTLAGISKYATDFQKIVGVKVVKDNSLEEQIQKWSGKKNFELIEANEAKYGKITDDNIRFINKFYAEYEIPLDPIYTGKMMHKVFDLASENYFPKGAKILCFHTGGLQGIKGANLLLQKKGKGLIVSEL